MRIQHGFQSAPPHLGRDDRGQKLKDVVQDVGGQYLANPALITVGASRVHVLAVGLTLQYSLVVLFPLAQEEPDVVVS